MCDQIAIEHETIVTGEELARLDDAALGHVVEEASVFTRVLPAQKNRSILALKRRGHVVGFIGDGINDAPSLHTADIGISVLSATNVARESADVILGRTGLRVLHRGILEGRRGPATHAEHVAKIRAGAHSGFCPVRANRRVAGSSCRSARTASSHVRPCGA
jgi:Mg2+-importing ATPase